MAITETGLTETPPAPEPATARPRWRVVLPWVITGLATLLVFCSLVAPDRLSRLTPLAFLRVPIEALVAAGLLIVLPRKPRRIAALVLGVLLGLTTIAKIFDIGFYESLARPFDPVSDWAFLPPAVDYLERTYSHTMAVLAVIGAIVLAMALLSLMALSVLRLSTIASRHRSVTARTVGILGLVWILLAVTGARFVTGEPVASYSSARIAYREANQVALDIEDQTTFAHRFANDPFAATPADQLLTGLRGKNVLLTFVESYGRVAIQDSDIAPGVNKVLDAGTASLRAAGFNARSAFLTSSTAGGGSWLAHSTLQSGLWVNTPQRYGEFTASNRLTLATAFKKAGWQTAGVMPANRYDWPEGALYGYDSILDSRNMGYQGKDYSFQSIPDQYTMSAVHQQEFAAPRSSPLFAEIDLVSSHAPWEPVPPMVDWATMGNGAMLTGAEGATDPTDTVFHQEISKVHADYGATVEYSLTTLIQYIERYGDDNLVMVFLGDHQPAPVVAGEDADRDVPITVVAKDPKVLDQIAGWGWQDGLRPDPKAPVWRMDEFRDRFLTAFGSQPAR